MHRYIFSFFCVLIASSCQTSDRLPANSLQFSENLSGYFEFEGIKSNLKKMPSDYYCPEAINVENAGDQIKVKNMSMIQLDEPKIKEFKIDRAVGNKRVEINLNNVDISEYYKGSISTWLALNSKDTLEYGFSRKTEFSLLLPMLGFKKPSNLELICLYKRKSSIDEKKLSMHHITCEIFLQKNCEYFKSLSSASDEGFSTRWQLREANLPEQCVEQEIPKRTSECWKEK